MQKVHTRLVLIMFAMLPSLVNGQQAIPAGRALFTWKGPGHPLQPMLPEERREVREEVLSYQPEDVSEKSYPTVDLQGERHYTSHDLHVPHTHLHSNQQKPERKARALHRMLRRRAHRTRE